MTRIVGWAARVAGAGSAPIALAAGVLAATVAVGGAETVGESGEAFLDRWLSQQAAVRAWSAEVVQIRRLKGLARPLQAPGRVWFAQPSRFRWQLGDPPRTVAVRTGEELIVVYPRLKQVERYRDADTLDESWKQVLALLEVGFPSDAVAFRSRYELISAASSGGRWTLRLRPAAKEARRLIEEVRLEVTAETGMLAATELVFPDGSTMRNEFSQHNVNPDLAETLFEVEIGPDYQEVNPLKGRK